MKKTDEGMNDTIINNLHKETVETTPDDGFVKTKVLRPAAIRHYGKGKKQYHKGFAKTVTYTTNDPRITRPFAYGISGIFMAIGILMLLIGNWFFGITFTFFGAFAFIKAKKAIDKVAEELTKEGKDVTVDSSEEKEHLANQIKELAKDSFSDVTASTFTKANYKTFAKKTIPLYCILAAIVTVLISVFVNVFLGLFILILSGGIGVLYYFLLSKLSR